MTTGAASDPGPWQRNKTVRTLGIVTAALATLVVVMLVVRMVAVNPRKTLDRGGLDAERVALVQDFVRTLYDRNIRNLEPSKIMEYVTEFSDDPKVQEQFEHVVNNRYTEENYYPYYVSYDDARAYYLQLLEEFGITEDDLRAAGIDLDSIDWNNLNLDDLDISSLVPMLIDEPKVVSADDGGCKVVARYVVKPDKSTTGSVTTQQDADVNDGVDDGAGDTKNTGVVTAEDAGWLLDEAHRVMDDLRQMAEDANNTSNATQTNGTTEANDPTETGNTTEPGNTTDVSGSTSGPVTPDPQEPEPVTPDPQEPEPVTPDPQEPEPVTPGPQEPEPVTPDPQEPEPVTPDPQESDPQDYYTPQEGEPVYEDVYTINFDGEGTINNFEPDVFGAPVENPDDYTTYAEPVPERTEPSVQTNPAPTTEPSAQTELEPMTTSPEAVEQNVPDESQTGQEAASRVVVQHFWFMRKRGWLV